MRREDGLTPAEREFEEALTGLQPAGTSIDRDALMYRAGYTAASRRSRPWQGLAALLAMGLAASLAAQGLGRGGGREPQITNGADRVRAVLAATDPSDEGEVVEPRYFTLRTEVLEKGLAALPEPAAHRPSKEPRLTLEELLGEPRGVVRPTRGRTIVDRILLGDHL